MTQPFAIDPLWADVLSDLNLRPADLLRRAALPEDLFARQHAVLEPEAFIRLWDTLCNSVGSDSPGLTLGQIMSGTSFSPPLLAALCSPDLATAIERLAQYKPLIGPMTFQAHDTLGGLEVTIDAVDVELPSEFIAAELVFLVNMARMALKEEIRPIAVELTDPPNHPEYKKFFGRTLRKGPFNRVVFTGDDARKPFLSVNASLFAAFGPDLQTRLDQLDRQATFAERVKAVLMEALPSGQAEASNVAKRLGVSTRSLQRRLAKEGTSFNSELQMLRTRLSRQYLVDTTYSSAEIAFLLGYEDPNSFIRAFHDWTGTTPVAMRREIAGAG